MNPAQAEPQIESEGAGGIVSQPKSALPPGEIAMAALASLVLIGLTASGRSLFGQKLSDWPETFASITGGICVWLTVREHIGNWPIGIANSLLFVYVFWQKRLFADSALNGLYVVLGFLGWYAWLFGGERGGRLTVHRAPLWLLGVVALFIGAGTALMHRHLLQVNDSAPFLDALTTALCLAAQYLLTRKFIENWYFWIVADLIYIPLYWSRGLMLTGVLYSLFLVLCILGLRQWERSRAIREA